jgi:hypothetical protein
VATLTPQALVDLLEELGGDLGGTGYGQADLDALLDELSGGMPLVDDAIPPLPEAPVSRLGEVIELGDHRLVCGDSCDPDVVARLMAEDRAAALVTDPPYGVGYDGRTRSRLRLQGDGQAGLGELLAGVFGAVDAHKDVFQPPKRAAPRLLLHPRPETLATPGLEGVAGFGSGQTLDRWPYVSAYSACSRSHLL